MLCSLCGPLGTVRGPIETVRVPIGTVRGPIETVREPIGTAFFINSPNLHL